MGSYPNKLTPTKSPPAVMWFKVYTGLMALMYIVFFIGGGDGFSDGQGWRDRTNGALDERNSSRCGWPAVCHRECSSLFLSSQTVGLDLQPRNHNYWHDELLLSSRLRAAVDFLVKTRDKNLVWEEYIKA